MLMSVQGRIVSSMSGPCWHELLEICYKPKTVDDMMSGKVVSRVLRGHFISEAILMTRICNSLNPETEQSQNNNDDVDKSTEEIEEARDRTL